MNFICDLCNGKFQFKYELVVHMEDHLNHRNGKNRKKTIVEAYKCDVCDKLFSRKESYENHKFLHNGKSPHLCFVCGKTFTRKIILENHQKGHFVDPNKRKIIKADFSCIYCPKIFTRKEYLKAHTSIHTEECQHKCSRCNKSFTRKEYLVNHIRIHTKETPFACELCSNKFMSVRALKAHVDRQCEQLTCKVCARTFTKRMSLTNHMIRSHSTSGKFVCHECGKRFAVNSNLMFHIKGHKD